MNTTLTAVWSQGGAGLDSIPGRTSEGRNSLAVSDRNEVVVWNSRGFAVLGLLEMGLRNAVAKRWVGYGRIGGRGEGAAGGDGEGGEVGEEVELNVMKQVSKISGVLKGNEGMGVREKFMALKGLVEHKYRLDSEEIGEVIRIDNMRKSSVWLEDLKLLKSSDWRLLVTLSNTGEAHIVTYSRIMKVDSM